MIAGVSATAISEAGTARTELCQADRAGLRAHCGSQLLGSLDVSIGYYHLHKHEAKASVLICFGTRIEEELMVPPLEAATVDVDLRPTTCSAA